MTTANWLDGPKVAAWIRHEIRSESRAWDATLNRRLDEWKDGKLVEEDTLDRALIRHNRNLRDIPEDYYTDPPPGPQRYHSDEMKKEALDLYRDGVPPTKIARRLGIDRSTIHKWRIREGVPPQGFQWNRDKIIGAIRAWTKRYGEPPSVGDWKGRDDPEFPSSDTLRNHFGSHNKAILAAGYKPLGPHGRRL